MRHPPWNVKPTASARRTLQYAHTSHVRSKLHVSHPTVPRLHFLGQTFLTNVPAEILKHGTIDKCDRFTSIICFFRRTSAQKKRLRSGCANERLPRSHTSGEIPSCSSCQELRIFLESAAPLARGVTRIGSQETGYTAPRVRMCATTDVALFFAAKTFLTDKDSCQPILAPHSPDMGTNHLELD